MVVIVLKVDIWANRFRFSEITSSPPFLHANPQ